MFPWRNFTRKFLREVRIPSVIQMSKPPPIWNLSNSSVVGATVTPARNKTSRRRISPGAIFKWTGTLRFLIKTTVPSYKSPLSKAGRLGTPGRIFSAPPVRQLWLIFPGGGRLPHGPRDPERVPGWLLGAIRTPTRSAAVHSASGSPVNLRNRRGLLFCDWIFRVLFLGRVCEFPRFYSSLIADYEKFKIWRDSRGTWNVGRCR